MEAEKNSRFKNNENEKKKNVKTFFNFYGELTSWSKNLSFNFKIINFLKSL
jgi:hypothetical protein